MSFVEGAKSLACYAERKGLDENSILPTMDDFMDYVEVAYSVARKAIESNLTRRKYSNKELYDAIHLIIAYQKVLMRLLIKSGLISDYQHS